MHGTLFKQRKNLIGEFSFKNFIDKSDFLQNIGMCSKLSLKLSMQLFKYFNPI
jgi:hypothetical protein